jgi:hypothetical protein
MWARDISFYFADPPSSENLDLSRADAGRVQVAKTVIARQ